MNKTLEKQIKELENVMTVEGHYIREYVQFINMKSEIERLEKEIEKLKESE